MQLTSQLVDVRIISASTLKVTGNMLDVPVRFRIHNLQTQFRSLRHKRAAELSAKRLAS